MADRSSLKKILLLQVLFIVVTVIRTGNAVSEVKIDEKPLFPRIKNNVEFTDNQACSDQSRLYREHLENLTLWAHEMWDASAKYTTGLLRGSVFQMGDWHECVTIKGPFSTRYCLATLRADIPHPESPRDPLSLHYSPYDRVLNRIYKNEDVSQQSRDFIQLGLCVPASCSPEDLQISLNDYLKNQEHPLSNFNVTYSAKVAEEMCQTEFDNDYFDSWDITFCFLCLIIILLVLFSTLYDFTQMDRQKCQEKPLEQNLSSKLCTSFSVRSNFLDLARVDESNPALSILYGLKTYSIFMIIMDHRFGTYLSGPISNFDYVEGQYRSKFAAYIFHGDLFVDSFFVLSGLLVTYGLLVQFQKRIINPFFIIFMRYVRLTPVYAFVVLYFASILNHTGSGPLWKLIIGPEVEDCRRNWWTNLLYINNYVNDKNMCMVLSWYLPCDFHYFIIAIVVVRILNKNKKAGLGILIFLLILSMLIPFAITVIYLRPALLQFYPPTLAAIKADPDFRLTYTKTHTRAEPYIIGMFAGYIYYKLKNTSKHLSRISSHVLTIISFLILLTCIATGAIFYNRYYQYNAIESGIYAALHRVAWAIGTVGLLFAASYGHATVLKSVLSWSPWVPLSKLGYGAYLIHMNFQLRAVAITTAPKYFTYFDVINLAFGDVVLSFMAALLLYLGIEAPLRKIFRELLGSPRRPNKPAQSSTITEENTANTQQHDSRL